MRITGGGGVTPASREDTHAVVDSLECRRSINWRDTPASGSDQAPPFTPKQRRLVTANHLRLLETLPFLRSLPPER